MVVYLYFYYYQFRKSAPNTMTFTTAFWFMFLSSLFYYFNIFYNNLQTLTSVNTSVISHLFQKVNNHVLFDQIKLS